MTKEEVYLRGCLLAVNELIGRDSSECVVRIDGHLASVSWDDITDWLVTNLDIIEARKPL